MQPPSAPDSEPSAVEDTAQQPNPFCRARRLILVGASVRAAAQSARRAGFDVVGMDLFGDSDTLAVCDHHISLSQPPSAIRQALAPLGDLPVIQTGGIGSLGQSIDDLVAACRRLGPSSQQASDLRATSFLRELADACGVGFPATRSDIADLAECDSSIWLRKQIRSCGGLGVQWAKPNDRIEPGFRFQRWIAGRNVGVSYLSDGHHVVPLGACRSLYTRVGSFPFVYAGSYGPINLSRDAARAVARLGGELVARSGLRGLFNADVIVDRAGKIWLLEVNPRWTASCEVIERKLVLDQRLANHQSLMGLGYHAMHDSLAASTRERLSGNDFRGRRFLKRIVFARRSGRYQTMDLPSSWLKVCDVPREGSPIESGTPIVTLLAQMDASDRRQWREIAETYRRLRRGIG